MSYFNDEQISYMKSLEAIPDESRCYCGWCRDGDCPHCPKGKTLALGRPLECPERHNYPHNPGEIFVHRRGCSIPIKANKL